MGEEKFNELYKKLNSAQKRAVDTIDGPVMVIAGPGTGKTTILTLRIANILKRTDTPPDAILALTFTEASSFNMRKKLVELVGSPGYKVVINTFHGFCNNIIKDYPERFPRIVGSTAMGELDRVKIMEKIISEGEFPILRPWGDQFHYVKPSLEAIKNLKRDGYNIQDLETSIKKDESSLNEAPDLYHKKGLHKGKMKGEYVKQKERLEKAKELLKVFESYEKALFANKLYDYEDMIVEVVKALRADADFLLILQENFQYILADEHQDANRSQNIILELLSNFHENPNLFIVGDEKQAIFRFQGASLENFLYFKKLYPKALVVNLEENYRSHQGILDASHSLIEKNSISEDFIRVRLKAGGKRTRKPIMVYELKTEGLEHFFVAKDIQEKLLSKNVKPEEIAVLYRENKEAFPVAEALARMGIPYDIESEKDLLRDEDVRKAILMFRAINDLSDNEALSKILFIDFLNISSIQAFETIRTSYFERKPLQDLVKSDCPQVWAMFNRFAALAKNKPLVEVFEIIIRESGLLQAILRSSTSVSRLKKLEAFFGEIKNFSSGAGEYFLSDFVKYLSLLENHGIQFKFSEGSGQGKAVRLMTAHRAKGLEFSHVYIVGAYDGHWGNKHSAKKFHLSLLEGDIASSDGKIEDERRLFYVAITRAKESVTISYGKQGLDGRERLRSQFIDEIDSELRVAGNSQDIEKAYEKIAAFNFLEKSDVSKSVKDPEYVKNLFLEHGLNVSALNNYLECPWKYFFVSLIRLPEAPNKHQMYGTAVHETLRVFFNKYRDENDMSRKETLDLFEHNLARQPFSSADFKEVIQKGRKSLGGYYDTYKDTWSRNLVCELKLGGIILNVNVLSQNYELVLNGRLDKIELLDSNRINVVDYKTSKAKSGNEIMGKTKNADGNYYRQLIFYKMLLDSDVSKKYEMQTGELDFTEPDEKMRYKKERFEIPDGEVGELKKLISRVATEIMTFAFWDKTCEEKKCEWCLLREQLS